MISIVYYRLSFLRCPELDIVFAGVICYCIFVLTVSYFKKTEKVSLEPLSSHVEETKTPTRRTYSIAFLRSVRSQSKGSEDLKYSISTKETEHRYSPVPSYAGHKTVDSYNYFRKLTPEPTNFVNRSPRGRLDADEEREYNQNMRERTPDYCPMAAEDLPHDIKVGCVHWLHQRNGRIHVQEPINGIKDIFFHLHDCELDPGDTIQLGDSVMFELSLYEGRLCAVKVKKMATKAIPSPDFSRRVMKHSKEDLPSIDALAL